MSDIEGLLRRAAADPELEDVLRRLVTGPVQELVAQALAQHRADAHADPLGQPLVFGDEARLHVHPTAKVNNALFNLSSGDVTVARYAFFGHSVSILTGSHDIEKFGLARQDAIPIDGHDIVIGEGAWVASHAIVVGPCTVGAHAVVGVGSLVREDVARYTVVAGSPARVIRVIDHDEDR